MADDKLATLADAGADELVGADTSCLLHLRARAEHEGRPVRDAPPRASCSPRRCRPTAMPTRMTGFTLAGTTLRERTADGHRTTTRLRGALARAVGRFGDGRPARWPPSRTPTGCARAARRLRHDVLGRLPDVLERFADNVLAAGGHVHWAADAADANAYITELAVDRGVRRRREGQVDGHRGDRRSTRRSRRPASTWSRPTSASGSSSSPTRPRATSSPRPSTSTATRSATSSKPSPAPDRELDAEPEHLAAFAREQLASPLPRRRHGHDRLQLRAWPRPARSCSSRTRATAGSPPRCPASTWP